MLASLIASGRMEQFIAGLPEWARTVFYLAAAIAGAVVFRQGSKGDPKPASGETSFELKAAMVDNRAVEKLSGEVAGQSIAIMSQTAAIKEQADAVREMSKIARQWMDDQEKAEERRLERRAEIAEQEADRHRRENEELRRLAGVNSMRKDQG